MLGLWLGVRVRDIVRVESQDRGCGLELEIVLGLEIWF